MYANCLLCESVAYDGGQVWSRSTGKCINSVCKYFNSVTIAASSNTSTTTVLTCEDASDPPPNDANCWYYSYYNSTSFQCQTSCPSFKAVR